MQEHGGLLRDMKTGLAAASLEAPQRFVLFDYRVPEMKYGAIHLFCARILWVQTIGSA
jgi:hypothetical protein